MRAGGDLCFRERSADLLLSRKQRGAVRRFGNRVDFRLAAWYEGCVGLFDLDAQGQRVLGTGMMQVHSSSPQLRGGTSSAAASLPTSDGKGVGVGEGKGARVSFGV